PALDRMRLLARFIVALAILSAIAAPLLAPHRVDDRFPELLNAPPSRVHVRDDAGGWHAPFIHPWRRVSQLEQRYEEDTAVVVPLAWLAGGKLVVSSDEARAPLLLVGADSFGRDVFTRILHGARISLGLSIAAALGALLLGGLIGAVAGYTGG